MKKDTVYNILKLAEQEHLNLYHDVKKEKVEKYAKKLSNKIESLSLLKSEFELQKMFALFKDAHTILNLSVKKLPIYFKQVGNDFYLNNILKNNSSFLYKKLVSINNTPIKTIKNVAKKYVSFETQPWFNYNFIRLIRDFLFLKRAGIICENANEVIYQFENCTTDLVVICENYETVNLVKNPNVDFLYEHKIIDGVLYIRYSVCMDDKNYLFSEFCDQISKQLVPNQQVIVDIRNNTGGSSEVIKPLIAEFKQKNITGFVLINEGVFSSGRFALKDLYNIGFKSIGTPTGGAAKSYGHSKMLNVDNVSFSVSIKLWEFENVFKTKGCIKPTYPIYNKVDDYINNNDPALKLAIYKIKNR